MVRAIIVFVIVSTILLSLLGLVGWAGGLELLMIAVIAATVAGIDMRRRAAN